MQDLVSCSVVQTVQQTTFNGHIKSRIRFLNWSGNTLGFPQRRKSGPLCLGPHDLTPEKQHNADGWMTKGWQNIIITHIIKNAIIIWTLNYYFKKISGRIRHYRPWRAWKNSVKSWRDSGGLILQPTESETRLFKWNLIPKLQSRLSI